MSEARSTRGGPRRPPKLDLRAFQSPTSTRAARRLHPRSLLDSHIHLWTRRQLDNGQMRWPTRPGGPEQLSGPHEMGDYGRITRRGITQFAAGQASFSGVVFVQAEVEHDDKDVDGSQGGWDASIAEVETVCAEALVCGVNVVALVPWAPVHHGSRAVAAYLARLLVQPSLVAYEAKLGYSPIKSFRYLLQDAPRGFFLTEEFVDGLDYLGRRGYAFDMTLDVTHAATRGPLVLDDAIEAISKVRELQKGTEYETKFILDHFAKPDLTVDATVPPSAFQTAYVSSLFALALVPSVYLKLSALLDSCDRATVRTAFDNYRAGDSTRARRKGTAYETVVTRVRTYVEPAIEAFGESRILVGSDWPMFRAKLLSTSSPSTSSLRGDDGDDTGSGRRRGEERAEDQDEDERESAAWAFEMQLYLDCLVEIGLKGESLDKVFETNARDIYGVSSI